MPFTSLAINNSFTKYKENVWYSTRPFNTHFDLELKASMLKLNALDHALVRPQMQHTQRKHLFRILLAISKFDTNSNSSLSMF